MRVLHLSDRLSLRGGAHWHLRGVLEALSERGIAVHLAVGQVERGVEAPCGLSVVTGLEARDRRQADLDSLLARCRPDIIHLHTVVNPAALEWAAERGAVITVQDHRYFCPARGKWTSDGHTCTQPMDWRTCAGCFEDRAYFEEVYALTEARLGAIRRMRVTVLSQYMARELQAVGVGLERISVIPPFVHDLERLAPPVPKTHVLFVGRLVETKGVLDAVAAWRRSGVAQPLMLAGTGPLRTRLESEPGVEVLGWVARPRLAALYRGASALLIPSRWQEPFGIAGLEALILGTPVVAWDSGGVREWHRGEGLVAWGDLECLARSLRQTVEASGVAQPPPGFDRSVLTQRLIDLYASCG